MTQYEQLEICAMSAFRCVQYIVFITLVLSMSLIIAAGALHYWYVSGTYKLGLWRQCWKYPHYDNLQCYTRDLFQFPTSHSDAIPLSERSSAEIPPEYHFDIALTALGGSVAFIFLACVISIAALFQKIPSRALLVVESLCAFIGGGCVIFGVVWLIIKVSYYERSWAFYLCYSGAGLCIISGVLAGILACLLRNAYTIAQNDDEILMVER